jgi:ATP-dependent Clp protease adaptor protein ClpS
MARLPELDREREGSLATEERKKTRRPQRFKVLLHNDDYTTMDFVVYVLIKHFRKSHAEATQIMLHVHHRGAGVAGIFPKEAAETKASEVMAEAREQGMPLLVTLEPAEPGED